MTKLAYVICFKINSWLVILLLNHAELVIY